MTLTRLQGARIWNKKTRKMDDYEMAKKPILFGVETTLIVGLYEYNQTRGLQSYIYPALHSGYGFVYEADGFSVTDIDSDGCGLVVKTNNNGDLVYMLKSDADNEDGWMNEIRVNVATTWDPYDAQVYCYNNLLASRKLLPPRRQLLYTINGKIPDGLTRSPTKSPIKSANPTTMTPRIGRRITNQPISASCPDKHEKKCEKRCSKRSIKKKCKKNCSFSFDKHCPKSCPSNHNKKCQKCSSKTIRKICLKNCNFSFAGRRSCS